MSAEQHQEKPQPVTDPEQINLMKYSILTQWMHLPVEHQAGTLLVLLKHTLGEQVSLKEKVEISPISALLAQMRGEETSEAFDIPFEITSICRADLQEVLSEEEVAQFSDEDMRRLAEKMADAYVGSGIFWDDLELLGQRILDEKKQDR